MTTTLPTLTPEEETRSQPASGVPSRGASDPEPGFGALATDRGPLPLQALDVRTTIDGLFAQTFVAQTFVNTHAEPRPTGLRIRG